MLYIHPYKLNTDLPVLVKDCLEKYCSNVPVVKS